MKKLALLFVALLSVVNCSKLEVNEANILGEWTETYDDYPYYAEEGFLCWNFKSDGLVDIRVYDVFAGDHTNSTKYQITHDEKDGSPIIFFPTSEYTMDVLSFVITKLTKKEMEWQRLGTTFQEGTVGSDFKHFTRK